MFKRTKRKSLSIPWIIMGKGEAGQAKRTWSESIERNLNFHMFYLIETFDKLNRREDILSASNV